MNRSLAVFPTKIILQLSWNKQKTSRPNHSSRKNTDAWIFTVGTTCLCV